MRWRSLPVPATCGSLLLSQVLEYGRSLSGKETAFGKLPDILKSSLKSFCTELQGYKGNGEAKQDGRCSF